MDRPLHLHVVNEKSPHWQSWLRFRDLLRANSDWRAWYAVNKQTLATRYARDRAAYTAAKGEVIARVLAEADQRPLV